MTDADPTRETCLDSSDARTLRISGPEDLLDALPRMLGYLPTRSVVLVALRPPLGRIALTLRVDLPARNDEQPCARLLAGHAQRAGATSAVLVLYDDAAAAAGRWQGASLTRAVRSALRERGGVRLSDALAVRSGRWRSLLCSDEGCCPPVGRLLRGPDDPSAAGVALAAEGAGVLPDRSALVASVAAPTGQRCATLLDLQERVACELAGRVEAGVPLAELRAETVTLFSAAVAAVVDGASPSDEVAARLIVGLVDVAARDAVLARAGGTETDGLLALLVDLVGRAVEPFDASVATALAWVAYARGDGTLANVAVDRALASDPGYSMALLIASSLEAGIHPDHIRAVSRAVSGE
jgi:uncharacterized protein DUF4192